MAARLGQAFSCTYDALPAFEYKPSKPAVLEVRHQAALGGGRGRCRAVLGGAVAVMP